MKTATIKEITSVSTWEGQFGKMYEFKLAMDNGENIKLNKKSADAFKVGDSVSYEDYKDAKGFTKQKEVKSEPKKPSYNPEANNRGAMLGMAMKLAFEMFYNKEKPNFSETINFAKRIFEESMAIYNETPSDNKSDEEVDLPF